MTHLQKKKFHFVDLNTGFIMLNYIHLHYFPFYFKERWVEAITKLYCHALQTFANFKKILILMALIFQIFYWGFVVRNFFQTGDLT